MAKSSSDQILDQLVMLMMGNKGHKEANLFLEDCARSPLTSSDLIWHHRKGQRVFIPPKDQDRVIMFSDNSGVYVHSDGFCTPMGEDISREVGQWQEV